MTHAMLLGLRGMRHRPWSSVVSVLCLALGLAASAAAFSLIDATALRPFGLQRSGDLAVVWESDPTRPGSLIEVSLPNFADWERQATSFESMAAFGSSHWPGIGRIAGESFPLAPRAVSITFFRTLGLAPALGRDFETRDLDLTSSPPVILSHQLWVTRFGGSPNAIGTSFFFDGVEQRVVGVMPRGFAYPDAPDMWTPVERTLGDSFARTGLTEEQQRALGVLEVLGRLRPGRTREQARAELSAIAQQLARRFDPSDAPREVTVTPFADVLLGRLGPRLWIALAMAAVVLLFACANVAAVRMAHMRDRLGELSARLCLGASRLQLLRHLTVEAVPLGIGAAVLSVVLAIGLVGLLDRVPAVAQSGVDFSGHRVTALAVLAVCTVLAWLLTGLLPAALVLRRLSSEALLAPSRTTVRGSRSGAGLLMLQVSLAICLVTLAAGALRAFNRLARTDMGFDTGDVVAVDVSAPDWKYPTPDSRSRLHRDLLSALQTLPGASAAAAVSVRPFRFGEIADGLPVRRPEDVTIQPGDAVGASRVVVTPAYFETLGVRIRDGRAFTDFDGEKSPQPVAIVSLGLARALWGEERVVGRVVQFFTLGGGWQSRHVVGVAADVRSRRLDRPALELYVPHSRSAGPMSSYIVRGASGVTFTEAMLRQTLHAVEPELALERVQSMGAVFGAVLAPSRLLTVAVSVLGTTGLVLLALGIFGAAAATLRAAWGEIAIRQAVGATPMQAARAPLRSLTIALAIGVLVGLSMSPVAWAGLEAVGLSEGVGLVTPIAAGCLTVIAAAAMAIWPSLRRAVRMTPAEILRRQ